MQRVLVIDDDPQIGPLLARVLARAGHEARAVSDGREGLRELNQWPVQVVVTDILMPDMDGLEIIMAIRREHPEVRIVAMSGGGHVASQDYVGIARTLGAHRTLQKPFTNADLLAAVGDAA